MTNDLQGLLRKLSNTHGISGYEDRVREVIADEVRPFVDEIKTDRMGNLIATRRGSTPRLMLAAHMDEIGLLVKYIDEKGFIHFSKMGGWFDQSLLNQRMVLHSGDRRVSGVIGSKPPHAMTEEDRKKPVQAEDMFIDIGATSREDAEKMGVSVGTPISPNAEFELLGNDRVTGKAFDNRAGCAMLIGALKEMKNVEATVHAVFTVQEEVGLKGARTSAFELNPDLAIAADVTFTGDHPGVEKKQSIIEVGKGPVIVVSDAEGRGTIVPEHLLSWLKEIAFLNNIPYQLEVGADGTTDASAIHLSREGIPTGVVCVPSRYIHTSVSVLSMRDLEDSTRFVALVVEKADAFQKRS